MTVRPPTLREKRRYVLVQLDPPGTAIDPKELYYAISDAVTSLWGDAAAGVIVPAVICAEGRYVVVRCRRGTERELTVAISTVTQVRDTRIALRTVATSGTIESLRDRMKTDPAPPGPAALPEEARFAGNGYAVVHGDGQKIDVIEKGFKNTHRLYLTTEDLEKNHATTIPDGI